MGPSLLTFLNQLQVAFAVLSHLHLLISRAPVLFSFDFKDFFCKYSDPSYIKVAQIPGLKSLAIALVEGL